MSAFLTLRGVAGASRRLAAAAVLCALFSTLLVAAAASPARADASYPGDARFYDWGSGTLDSGLYQNRSNTQQTDWMKWVDNATKIGDLSIPGTHDSMAAHGGDSPQTQGLCGDSGPGDITPCDLTEQLESGIRFFDIRIACLDNARTGYKEDLTIWHGDAYQYANLGDVLDAFRSFLKAHDQEVVLMRIATEHGVDEAEHEGCGGDLSGYGSQNEEQFAEYWQEYSDIFWTNNGAYPGSNSLPKPFPTIGEARGKVIPLTHFTTTHRYGLFWKEVTTYDNYDENVGATSQLEQHWNDKRDKGLIPANNGIANRASGDTTYFHTGFNGAGGVMPNTVAFGDGDRYPGVNYYGLQYLMDRNLTSTGIIGMDFPGGALINAIIAHNLRYADTSKHAALNTSFNEIVEHLAAALGNHEHSHASTRVCDAVTCGEPSEGASIGFFDHVMPGKWFHAMAMRDGDYHIEHDGLYGRGTTDGMVIVVWEADFYTEVSDAEVAAVVNANAPTSGTPHERAHHVHRALKARYPGTLWQVIAKRAPDGDKQDNHVHVYAYYAQFHKGEWHNVAYYVAGYSAGTLSGTLASSHPRAPSGSTVTYNATFTPTAKCLNGGSCRDAPSGVVKFTDRGVVIPGCEAKPVSAHGEGATAVCSVTYTDAQSGAHYIDAHYSGDGYRATYAAPQLVQRITRPLNVAAGGSKTYGSDTSTFTPSYTSPSGVTVSGTLTCTRTRDGEIGASTPTGTYVTNGASCSGLSLSGPNAGSYDIVYVDSIFEVEPAPLTVTASSGSVTYGQAPPAVTPAYAGFVNGESASSLTTPATCSTSATSTSSVGDYATTCSGAASNNYAISYVAGTMKVGPATLTVTAGSPSTVYGDAAPTVKPTYSGFVNGDDESIVTQSPACSTSASKSSGVGSYDTSCTGGAATNYSLDYVDGSHTIRKAPLTVTASSPTMTYGDPTPAVVASYDGFVLGQTASALTTAPACTTSAGSDTHAGTTVPTRCSGAASPNYAISYIDGKVTVMKKTLTVTASSAAGTYGTTPAAVTPSYDGFVNGEGASVLDTPPACSTAATARSAVGAYSTTCSGAADNDYAFLYTSGVHTVTPAPLTVQAPDARTVYGSDTPVLEPSYSGFVNGEGPSDLTFQAVCGTSRTKSSAVGTYPISCPGAAGANYAVTNRQGELTVVKAPLAVVAHDKTRRYDEADPTFTWHLTGFVNGDTTSAVTGSPTLSTTAERMSPVADYPINVAAGSLDAQNYRFVPTAGTLSIIRALTQTVTEPADMSSRDGAPYGSVAARVTYGPENKPVVGMPVVFDSGGTVLCSGTTDTAGRATCALTDRSFRPLVAAGGFTATFAGARNFEPSSDTGAVSRQR